MFTGIVEVVGTVTDLSVDSATNGVTMTISDCAKILDDCNLGDSIAVNGTCLTVTAFDPVGWFTVGVAPETLARTSLGSLKSSSKVNLERAVLASNSRFGGHYVQGHVDTTANIVSITPDKDSIWFRFSLNHQQGEENLMQYIINKGFISIDGTSLTLCNVDFASSQFSIMLIDYSQNHTIMTTKSVGDKVNIEVDMLGKYVGNIINNTLNSKDANGNTRLDDLINNALQKRNI
ncbi:Riboflavin synthase [Smittium culicis]|uniref:Riboflavin synthase n=1 Tax=Smittium culicis TaxID=133412 RepID=A0A1R1YPB7_9FUNG|nr:Riboflavin synthase [Smittium culicis]OMJ28748.1 Riboflavin synthase [Smittium culicis]